MLDEVGAVSSPALAEIGLVAGASEQSVCRDYRRCPWPLLAHRRKGDVDIALHIGSIVDKPLMPRAGPVGWALWLRENNFIEAIGRLIAGSEWVHSP